MRSPVTMFFDRLASALIGVDDARIGKRLVNILKWVVPRFDIAVFPETGPPMRVAVFSHDDTTMYRKLLRRREQLQQESPIVIQAGPKQPPEPPAPPQPRPFAPWWLGVYR